MSLALLLESAVRGLLLGLCVYAVLRVARLRQLRQVWSIWVVTLVAALSMVALMRLMPLPVTVAIGGEMIRAAPQGAVPHGAGRDLVDVAAQIYIVVAAALCLRLLIGLALSARLLRSASKLTLPGAPDVRVAKRITTPVTVGRIILVPTGFNAWPADKKRAVLVHEQAHVRWFDFYALLLANLHCALLWFSPFAWWLRAELRDLAEQASDEAAIAVLGDGRRYAEILLDIARTAQRSPLAAVAMARSGAIERRVDLALHYVPQPRRHFSPALLTALLAIGVAVISIAPRAQVADESLRLQRVPGSGVNPFYPDRAQQAQVEGYAEFRIAIDADGKPTRIELVQEEPPGYGFAEAARQALETWTFRNEERRARVGTYRLTLRLR
jgi:TonB family protein